MDLHKNENLIISEKAFKIGEAAILGMLYEVSTVPSPGLVSPISSGAHTDMDFFTFLNSSAAITGAMYLCAQIGLEAERSSILEDLRRIGKNFEENMFIATKGINTQKGILFIAGVIAAATGRCIKQKRVVDRYNISKECSLICNGLTDKELKHEANKLSTNGLRVFQKYGYTGIRGEVEKGLPSVINFGIPALRDALDNNLNIKQALAHTLITLMTEVEDTTVINRCGIEGYNLMKTMAKEAISLGGMKTEVGTNYIHKMEEIFIDKNISPGGAADLLAATVMINKLEKDFEEC